MLKRLKYIFCNHDYIYAKTDVYRHETASVYICINCGKIKKIKINEAH